MSSRSEPDKGLGWSSIPALARDAARRFDDRTAIVDGERRLTYAELADLSRDFGAALVGSGIQSGDRIAVWAFNSFEWVVAALGIFQAGAVLVPVNTRFKGREAADIMARSRCRALITVTDFLGADYLALLEAADIALPDLGTRIVARGPVPEGAAGWSEFVAQATGAGRAQVDRRGEAASLDDPCDILFTSGTTGVAKGVVQTHGRTLLVARDWATMTSLGPEDRYLMVNPYFHMFGLKAGILASVVAGATMLPEPVFDVVRLLRRVANEGVTVLPGPPTLYQSILDHPERDLHDLSSLRVAVTGAADIPVELIRRVTHELPFSTVITGYGLTEGGTATATSPDDDVEAIATTVGRPRPGFEIRVVDRVGNDVPVEEAGEILLRGPSIMLGYLDDPRSTSDVLSADGWLKTGDVAVMDRLGRLRIVGRAKDMFIVGGFNAYPAEIEHALLRHPAIGQAAVIGVPDDRLGEVGMAFVVLRRGSALSQRELIEWCRGQMANYKVPRSVEIVDELPLNATGKVMKDVLRERARASQPPHEGA
jgi:acyl-CoA synthetase (AMP-forming)/AMP-acid ligase II